MLAYYDSVAHSCLSVMVSQDSSLCRWAVNVIWEIITLFFTSVNLMSELEWNGDFPIAEGRLKPISDTAAVKRGQVKWENERLQSAVSSTTSIKKAAACSNSIAAVLNVSVRMQIVQTQVIPWAKDIKKEFSFLFLFSHYLFLTTLTLSHV